MPPTSKQQNSDFMAAPSPSLNSNMNNNVARFDPKSPSPRAITTFVQADPSTFQAVVQKLTGASCTQKLPVTYPTRLAALRKDKSVGHGRPAFNLQERRQNRRKKLQNIGGSAGGFSSSIIYVSAYQSDNVFWDFNGSGGDMVLAGTSASTVSTLELMISTMSREELEKKGIAEKGYYFHPSPPRSRGSDLPELLPLFPLHSPSTSNLDSTS